MIDHVKVQSTYLFLLLSGGQNRKENDKKFPRFIPLLYAIHSSDPLPPTQLVPATPPTTLNNDAQCPPDIGHHRLLSHMIIRKKKREWNSVSVC